MFELENAVTDWRAGLKNAGSCTNADIEELETHLREQIDHLLRCELTEEEAFLIASRRLGDTSTLTHEFQKINGGSIFTRRLFWMVAGILTYLLTMSASSVVTQVCTTLASLGGMRGVSLVVVNIVAKFLSLGVALVLLYTFWRSRSACAQSSRLIRSWPGKIVLVWFVALAMLLFTAIQILLPYITIRLLSIEEYGEMALALRFVQFPWPILVPIAMAILLISLRIPGRRDLNCQN